jgi:hypothetical protein
MPNWLANIYLIFLLEFLYFYFPTFCQMCLHTYLTYPSTPYALSMKLTGTTSHIMMKSGPCARGLSSRRASRFSSVSLDIFNSLLADFSPQKRLRMALGTPT